jgi:hypothetical protein
MRNDLAFLKETLDLWGIAGTVEAGEAPVVAVIRADNGAIVWIERTEAGTPFRWLARWRAAGEAPGGVRERRPRACASVVGLLSALRSALGVDRGTPLRVAPAPPSARSPNSN